MNIKLKFANLESTESLETYADTKFRMLEKILVHLDPEGTADLNLELALTTHHHQKGDIYEVKANLHIPGKTFQINETQADLYAAIDMAKDTLYRALERYKDLKMERSR
jgi:ribosomal subunit interface protein